MILKPINAVYITTNLIKKSKNPTKLIKNKGVKLLAVKLTESKRQMQEIIENYKSLWLRSIEERKAIARVGSQAKFMMLNRTRLMEESATEIEEFLWNEFKVCKENLYYLHLRIAEHCLTTWFDDVNEKEASVLFLNRTFDNWTRNYASIVQKEQLKKVGFVFSINRLIYLTIVRLF